MSCQVRQSDPKGPGRRFGLDLDLYLSGFEIIRNIEGALVPADLGLEFFCCLFQWFITAADKLDFNGITSGASRQCGKG